MCWYGPGSCDAELALALFMNTENSNKMHERSILNEASQTGVQTEDDMRY